MEYYTINNLPAEVSDHADDLRLLPAENRLVFLWCAFRAADDEGNMHVLNFEFPGGFAANFPDSLYDRPSKVSIVANTDCEIYQLSTKIFQERLKRDPDFELMVTKTSEHLFDQVYDRLIESYTSRPKQRYERLIAEYPEIFEQFQLKDIASFLRITPTHLSRLRKK